MHSTRVVRVADQTSDAPSIEAFYDAGAGSERSLPQRSSGRRGGPGDMREMEGTDLAVLQRVLDGLQLPGPADGDGPTTSDGTPPDGQSPEGDQSPDGQSPDGRSPDGRSPEGQSPEGQSSEASSVEPLTQHWPDLRLAAMTLPGTVAAVPLARHQVRDWCGAWSVPSGVTDDTLMVVAELVGNAVVHGCGPVGMVVALVEGCDRLVVDVYDAAPPNTMLRRAVDAAVDCAAATPAGDPLLLVDLDDLGDGADGGPGGGLDGCEPGEFAGLAALATSGRGLALVAAVSRDLQVLPHQRTGKTVRAVLDTG